MKLIAVILPLVSACSSTPSSARSVPVDAMVSTSGAGATTSIVTAAAAAAGRPASWFFLRRLERASH